MFKRLTKRQCGTKSHTNSYQDCENEMRKLNDKNIRFALKNFLDRRKPIPTKIIEELRIHNGNAIADVVTVHKSMHCYEIKGDQDNIYRALKQATYYNTTFAKITLVTTEKHVASAIKNLPNFWGIIVCKYTKKDIVFSYVRSAKQNPFINKKEALMSMWKSELMEFSQELSILDLKQRHNRDQFADAISKVITLDQLHQGMSQKIIKRVPTADWLQK